MIHYMLLLGYILVTCNKKNTVTLHVTFILCTGLLDPYIIREIAK